MTKSASFSEHPADLYSAANSNGCPQPEHSVDLDHAVADVKLSSSRLPVPGQEKLPELPRSRRTLRCPDLLSGIYLQFYLFVNDDTPMRHCENPACGMPFPPRERTSATVTLRVVRALATTAPADIRHRSGTRLAPYF
jgi:hypothetical protein